MAGNMVPVDYFEGLLRAVVVHLEEAGADFTVQGKHSAYCTLLPEEYHNTKLNAMLGWEAATNALVNIPGNAPTNASANASASAPANAPTNTSGNTPTKVQRAGAHPLVALVANKQDPTVEFLAQASTEALAAEAALQASQQSMSVERDKIGAVAQQPAEAAAKATSADKAAMERMGAAENEVAN